MGACPHCGETIRPVIDQNATPHDGGLGIAGATWVCPECNTILSVSEVDLHDR